MTVKLLREKRKQIKKLCYNDDIEIVINPHLKTGGWAHLLYPRKIEIKEVKSNVTYAYALHELGHLLGTRQSKAYSELEQEAAAWKWARENALEWTSGMEKVLQSSLQTYIDHAKNHPEKRFIIPQKGNFFWKVKKGKI